ncbi:hypothetical protein K501DRAFT_328899 [Backusella circina FSU 941]|nr:hypothetical protein K501DRAFT_338821 [Backusella circina FSU 941]KAI8889751.1 hypothetical protein K501DRAFT_328899 [Backusella circina FSU 941]
MTDSKKHIEELHNRSELLSLELDDLNDDIDRKEKKLNKLKQALRELDPEDESSELYKILQEKKALEKKLTSLDSIVNEKMELVEALESENILDEEEMTSVMKDSLQDLEEQARKIQKEVDEKLLELKSLK